MKTKNLVRKLSLLSALALGNTALAACLATETEPNNTDTQANSGLCSGTAVSGTISSSSDYDWFRFEVPATGTISISMSHAAGIDLDWYLYKATGSYVAYRSTSSNPETGSYNATSTGTYYLRVKRYAGTGSYSLNVTLPGGGGGTPTACTLPSKVNLGKTGNATPKASTTIGGTVMMGGGPDVDEAIKWMIARAGGGDFVVLRSTGTNAYNEYIYGLGGVNSVQTLLITNTTQANDACVVQTIKNAGAVFMAGGNQADYINYFKGQGVGNALNYLIGTKRAPVGGTSAGMAILGQYYHPGGAPDTTAVLQNPTAVTIGNSFLANPLLANLVTDTHFTERNRQPRLATFMASSIYNYGAGWAAMSGVGADENTAVAIDAAGAARVYGTGNALFVRGTNSPEVLQPSTPLTWYRAGDALRVYKVPGTATGANSFNLVNWTGSGGTTGYWSSNNGAWATK
ncbi:pre-peptidase C-terminal domain-containing protein [Massilia sp. PAMC28688]|uniref:pre-peptidase C-terminal domain-containing protein n=1 Tax=Massilia sp. PAMC28688 TaxID=2861283 RepID=UPI001C63AD22|nr:pre-peptidase C-terminal domain-containing protein [Massilia sp. PAMC28688]QYF94858.1 pre-peptidase C-terminal domain-containing protein [Massilia sp. PAMC28688]